MNSAARKTAMVVAIVAAGFITGWILMVPSMDFFERHFIGRLFIPPGTVRVGPWMTRMDLARPETPAFVRAYIARIGIAANQAEEALYWNALADSAGNPLTGDHDYEVRFPGPLPVGKTGFWSLTVYNRDYLLVPNGAKTHALGDRSRLVKKSDGSFVILLSPKEPAPGTNWIPTPAGEQFYLTIRIYVPAAGALGRPEGIPLPEIRCSDCK
jgi:hypothetical protein